MTIEHLTSMRLPEQVAVPRLGDQRGSLPHFACAAPPRIAVPFEVLREDDRAIVCAASAASKATDYLLAFRPRATSSQGDGANEEEAA